MIDLTLEQLDDYLKFLYEQLKEFKNDYCINEKELNQFNIELAKLKEHVLKSIYIPKSIKERINQLEIFDYSRLSNIEKTKKGIIDFISRHSYYDQESESNAVVSSREIEYIEYFLINTSRLVHIEIEKRNERQ